MGIELEGILYLSASEVTQQIGITRQTLWRWRQEGHVPLGRRYREKQVLFTSEEVEAIRGYANRMEPLISVGSSS